MGAAAVQESRAPSPNAEGATVDKDSFQCLRFTSTIEALPLSSRNWQF
jgi:hypothetical protein